MMPWSTLNSHIQPSPEIWFETEHFEKLGFLVPRLKVPFITSWAWNASREKLSSILEICKVELESILRYEQNPKNISKMEKIDFSAKFAWKLKFHENRGKFTLKQWF